ncbi:MAG: VOC family protein [Myxococcota bacterium]
MRFHTHLPVQDLQQSRTFYEALLGVSPAKEKPDYLKFLTPELNLAFSPAPTGYEPPPVHLGFELSNQLELSQAEDRLRRSGIQVELRDDSVCCYAAQDKFWVTDPSGYRWELYVLIEDADHREDADSKCCLARGKSAESVQSGSA